MSEAEERFQNQEYITQLQKALAESKQQLGEARKALKHMMTYATWKGGALVDPTCAECIAALEVSKK